MPAVLSPSNSRSKEHMTDTPHPRPISLNSPSTALYISSSTIQSHDGYKSSERHSRVCAARQTAVPVTKHSNLTGLVFICCAELRNGFYLSLFSRTEDCLFVCYEPSNAGLGKKFIEGKSTQLDDVTPQ